MVGGGRSRCLLLDVPEPLQPSFPGSCSKPETGSDACSKSRSGSCPRSRPFSISSPRADACSGSCAITGTESSSDARS
jgi:hypothetical protein